MLRNFKNMNNFIYTAEKWNPRKYKKALYHDLKVKTNQIVYM